ncbi:MAG: putative rane protein [Labilithrix sp.]|nr:putative rane protein [Labilithrix sp.]
MRPSERDRNVANERKHRCAGTLGEAKVPNAPKLTPRALRTTKIVVVALVIALLVVAHRLGVLEQFGDPERVRQTLVRIGPWGYVAFIVAYAVLQPFGVPGTVFIMAAPLIWPWPVAFALSMTGTMAASVIGFSFSRFVARDWISKKVPARFRKYDDALATRAFRTVFLLRLVFWMPPLLHAFFGVSKVRFSTHFWGSLAGYVLPLFLVSFFGQELFDVVRRAPIAAWIALGAALATIVTGAWLYRRRRASS